MLLSEVVFGTCTYTICGDGAALCRTGGCGGGEVRACGAVFGGLRPYGRTLAYAVSMLLFSVYHVWGYALQDPVYWIYLLQYLPVSWLLCRCYERCDSIWGSILFHALVNAVSVRVLTALA